MRRIILLLLLSCFFVPARAQYFTIKTNLPSLAFNSFSFTGEYAFRSNGSIALNLNYRYPKGTFRTFKDKDGFRYHLNGMYITPAFRIYPQNEAPKGFYWGPYFRMGRFGSQWDGAYEPDTATFVEYSVKLNLTELGLGVQAGYQFILQSGFTIDLLFIGPRISYFGFKGDIQGDLNEDIIYEIIDLDGLDEDGFYGIGKSIIDWLDQSAIIRLPVIFPAYRIGFSIGYTF
ncbi:MAG: DUF3575 domain-containing protein [Bacteroidetes bacterium]|nr:DUF3575 domain-containing protein [Bacteroidota bacterium]MBL6964482.1 DUF3575 domain-containing protein [Bacteroidota bacterium]